MAHNKHMLYESRKKNSKLYTVKSNNVIYSKTTPCTVQSCIYSNNSSSDKRQTENQSAHNNDLRLSFLFCDIY